MRVRAAGVNPVDAYIRTGTYASKPPLPYTPGNDGAGEVEVGRRRRQAGSSPAIASTSRRQHRHAAAPAPTPSRRSARRRSCTVCRARLVRAGRGARRAVRHRVSRAVHAREREPGETVLVHGATGGVGIAAVELAHAHGMRVIGTAAPTPGCRRSASTAPTSSSTTSDPDYLDEIMKATGGTGVDVILEMAAHVNLDRDLGLLAKYGRVVVIGNRGRVEIDPRGTMGRDAAILGMTLFNVTPAEFAEIHAALVAGLANGTLNPVVGREFRWPTRRARTKR